MKKLIFNLLFFISISEASAQCCSPGNPAGGYGNNGTLEANSLKLFGQFKYSYSGRYMQGDDLYADDNKNFQRFVKDAEYNFVGLGAALGISSRLTMEAETGYFINKTQNYIEGILPKRQVGSGFTDLSFLIKPSIYKRGEVEFTPAIGLKVPLGKGEQKYRGAILPPDLQSTTGAVNYIAGFFLYKGFLKKHFRLFVVGRYEFPGNNTFGIRYGNNYVTALFLSYSARERLVFVVQTRYEIRNRDRSIYSGSFYSSGSHKLFLVPQITYSLTMDWELSLFSDIPVYQYYNGYQLGNTFAASLMITRKIQSVRRTTNKLN
jgi:hypothetical protein